MANTSLNTDIQVNDESLISDANIVHAEINELSRSTGLRDITSLLMNGWTATRVYLLRERNWVHLMPRGLDGSAATSNQILQFGPDVGQISTGFRPVGYSFEQMLRAADGSTTFIRADANSILGQTGVNVGGYHRTISWYSTSGFPTILPGVEA